MPTPSAFVDADAAQAAAASTPPGTLLKPTNTPGHVPPPANLNIQTHQPGPQDAAAAPEPLSSKPIERPAEEAPAREESAPAGETKLGEQKPDTFKSVNPMDIAKGFEEALANTEPDDDGSAPKPKAKPEAKKEEAKPTPPPPTRKTRPPVWPRPRPTLTPS